MKNSLFFLAFTFLINDKLFSQNSEYFDTENERYWGISKNSWGGLIER